MSPLPPPPGPSWRHWRVWDRHLPVWYDTEYRLPRAAFGKRTGLEPRRADLVAWYLLEWRWITPRNLRSPVRIRFEDVARVHTEAYLDSLARHGTLARIFGVDSWDVPVDELMRTIRLGCGGTLAAARESLARILHRVGSHETHLGLRDCLAVTARDPPGELDRRAGFRLPAQLDEARKNWRN